MCFIVTPVSSFSYKCRLDPLLCIPVNSWGHSNHNWSVLSSSRFPSIMYNADLLIARYPPAMAWGGITSPAVKYIQATWQSGSTFSASTAPSPYFNQSPCLLTLYLPGNILGGDTRRPTWHDPKVQELVPTGWINSAPETHYKQPSRFLWLKTFTWYSLSTCNDTKVPLPIKQWSFVKL